MFGERSVNVNVLPPEIDTTPPVMFTIVPLKSKKPPVANAVAPNGAPVTTKASKLASGKLNVPPLTGFAVSCPLKDTVAAEAALTIVNTTRPIIKNALLSINVFPDLLVKVGQTRFLDLTSPD